MRPVIVVVGLIAALPACGSGDVAPVGPSDGGTDTLADAAEDAPFEVAAIDGGLEAGRLPVLASITTEHRFIAGKMFGGWGPHLGHLARTSAGEPWFVDDTCSQSPNDALREPSLTL